MSTEEADSFLEQKPTLVLFLTLFVLTLQRRLLELLRNKLLNLHGVAERCRATGRLWASRCC